MEARAVWRAVFPIRKHEFAAGWWDTLKGGLDIKAAGELHISVDLHKRADWRATLKGRLH